jgi:hypothetical protein
MTSSNRVLFGVFVFLGSAVLAWQSWWSLGQCEKLTHANEPLQLLGTRRALPTSLRQDPLGGIVFGLGDTLSTKVDSFTTSSELLLDLSATSVLPSIRQAILDPMGLVEVIMQSPALRRDPDGSVFVVARIDTKYNATKEKSAGPGSKNRFPTHFLWEFRLNSELNVMEPGGLVSLLTPSSFASGPLDPRLFSFQGTNFLLFNQMVFARPNVWIDSTFFYDLSHRRVAVPLISGEWRMLRGLVNNNGKPPQVRDKNWIPLITQKQALFFRFLDPLQVLDCSEALNGGSCTIHFPRSDNENDPKFHLMSSCLRGSTPFVHWAGDYYWSIAHGTIFLTDATRLYTNHYLLVHINPFRIVFLSDPIPPLESLVSLCKLPRLSYLSFDSFFPVGLIVDGNDTCVISLHVNDEVSVLVRLRGFRALFEHAVALDSQAGFHKIPPEGYIHHQTRELSHHLLRKGQNFSTDK